MSKICVVLSFFCILFPSVDAFAEEWYQGGNLHQANALEWQVAKKENKLATCADFVATMWTKKMLKPSIHTQINSVNDMRPFAEKLVANLDEAFKKEPDPIKNNKMYANQKVNGTVALLIVMLGWLK